MGKSGNGEKEFFAEPFSLNRLNQIHTRVLYTQIKFSKSKEVGGKASFFVISPFCTPPVCLYEHSHLTGDRVVPS